MLYTSDRIFQIWIYAVGHSSLLIRSPNKEEDEAKGYNIDIEFWGVAHLDLPDIIRAISIQEIQQNIPARFSKYSSALGYKIFEIESKGDFFYVVAAGCKIGKNNWENENRILNPNLEYDEIIK